MTYSNKIISSFLIIIATLSFFIGFSMDEISMGAGGYNGDFKFVKKSIQIFEQNSIIQAIHLFSESSNRTPLIYILHKLFNPYFTDEIGFRYVVLLISCSVPLLFYFCLREKFRQVDNQTLLLLSSVIFFNPFFRTSSFWGLEENYAVICTLAAIYFLLKISNNQSTKNLKLYINLFFLTFFSSLCIYFDQKFLIIPLICFFKVVFNEHLLRFKIFTTILYFLFSIPFLFLMKLWGGIFPSNIYDLGNEFYFHHVGFAITIVAFIFLPFIFLKNINFKNQILSFINDPKVILYGLIIIIYILLLFYLFDSNYIDDKKDGGGIIKKLSFIFFESFNLRIFFIFLSFFVSWFFILFFIEKNLTNYLITFYFLILSFVIKPFYQEYFDPIIFILLFFIYKIDFKLNLNKIYFFYFYFLIFLIGTNNYYN